MEQIKLKAYGKINLGLDVVRRREDGYHEVRMVMQTVGIYDSIYLTKKDTPGITLKCNLSFLPVDEGNLAYRAAKMLMDEFDVKEGVEISLRKYLPVAAGMAGGSTDCAAVLFGVNRIFHLGLTKRQLMERGVKLGADVPYCLMRGTALAEGIGEKLTRLPDVPQCPVLIAKPPISVSTKFVYENLHANELTWHPDIDGMVAAIHAGDLTGICSRMENVLETVTEKEYPVISQIKDCMKQSGAYNSIMSGSGPTVFGLFPDEATAEKARQEILKKELARQVYLTNFFTINERR
ncbi:MAG: 4-(cytidine 5'-diphospho)-2-C-methyl-D-erythritol kinase [Lachnospiraceae bacterium]|nr:4-(cytidine 5'-diphospho)-2-C-methyl-D-erythritol kinase [Lachnospiraceae bacterium]